MNDNKNSDRQLVLLEDIQSKVELIAEGHMQLLEGQMQLRSKMDDMNQRFDRLDLKVDRNTHDIRGLKAAMVS